MAKIYADAIRKGLKRIEDVPAALQAQVRALLGEASEPELAEEAVEE